MGVVDGPHLVLNGREVARGKKLNHPLLLCPGTVGAVILFPLKDDPAAVASLHSAINDKGMGTSPENVQPMDTITLDLMAWQFGCEILQETPPRTVD